MLSKLAQKSEKFQRIIIYITSIMGLLDGESKGPFERKPGSDREKFSLRSIFTPEISMKKKMLMFSVLFSLFGFLPALALSAGMGGNIKQGMVDSPIQNIDCRLNHLTDIVFPGKILKVVMSDSRSHDFKLVGTKVGFENHLVVEPLKKGVESDFFIYGTDRISYLKVKTVPDGQEYDLRFDVKGNKKVLSP